MDQPADESPLATGEHTPLLKEQAEMFLPHYPRWFLIFLGMVVLGGAAMSGASQSLFGATLPDLALITNSSLQEISTIFIWLGLGILLGCILSGPLLVRFNSSLTLAVSLCLMGISTILLPWCPNFIGLTLMGGVSQFFNGIIGVGASFQCFNYWTKNGHAMMQANQLLYNLGKAVAPIIAGPFLAPAFKSADNFTEMINKTMAYSSVQCKPIGGFQPSKNETLSTETSIFVDIKGGTPTRTTKVHFVFLIIGATCVLFALGYLATYLAEKFRNPPYLSDKEKKKIKKVEVGIAAETKSKRKAVTLLTIAFFFSFLYAGLEMAVTGLLLSWVTESLYWDKQSGLLISFMYQAVKIITNALVIIISKFLSPWTIFMIDVIILICSSIFMYLYFGTTSCALSIWTTTAFTAVATSNIHAAGMGTVNMFMEYSGTVSAIFYSAFGLGTMVIPPLSTFIFTNYGAFIFPIILVALNFLIGVTFLGITAVIYKKGKWKELFFSNYMNTNQNTSIE